MSWNCGLVTFLGFASGAIATDRAGTLRRQVMNTLKCGKIYIVKILRLSNRYDELYFLNWIAEQPPRADKSAPTNARIILLKFIISSK
jgi:hypothetical protein